MNDLLALSRRRICQSGEASERSWRNSSEHEQGRAGGFSDARGESRISTTARTNTIILPPDIYGDQKGNLSTSAIKHPATTNAQTQTHTDTHTRRHTERWGRTNALEKTHYAFRCVFFSALLHFVRHFFSSFLIRDKLAIHQDSLCNLGIIVPSPAPSCRVGPA